MYHDLVYTIYTYNFFACIVYTAPLWPSIFHGKFTFICLVFIIYLWTQILHSPYTSLYRARIFKLLRSSEIDSNESILPVYVAWRAGTITLYSYSVPSPHRLFKNSSTVVYGTKSGWCRRERGKVSIKLEHKAFCLAWLVPNEFWWRKLKKIPFTVIPGWECYLPSISVFLSMFISNCVHHNVQNMDHEN